MKDHPNSCWRCTSNSFPDLTRIFSLGDKTWVKPETIEENEGAYEAAEFDLTREQIIEKIEKKAAEIAEEHKQWYKEIENICSPRFW